MKVILDGVFNHCGAFHRWLDRENFYFAAGNPPGAYRDKDSPYRAYFRWYDDAWPNNECYDGWWGHSNHPKLYYEGSKELYNDILRIAKKWVSAPYNADGWRLDVAADLGYSPEVNHRFWKDFRDAVKSANPNAVILAEHYGDPSAWLDGAQWDSIMNYDAFMEPLTWFLTGMEKHSERFEAGALNDAHAFQSAMRYFMSRLPSQSLAVAMNELSNHDHSRFLTRTNKTPGRLHTHGAQAAEAGVSVAVMLEAVAVQFTWPGAPTVYYGDEAGLAGWTDPDNRRTFPWGGENAVVTEFHKLMIRLRKSSGALRRGALEYLNIERGLLAYGRFYKDEAVVTAVNNLDETRGLNIPVWRVNAPVNGTMRVKALTEDGRFKTDVEDVPVINGFAEVTIPPHGAMILVCGNEALS
jgi:alpha-glucosidase